MIEQQLKLIRDPKTLLLTMAEQRTVADVLRLVVDDLASSQAVALARIWLIRPGEGCSTCPMRSECPDQTNCLHLVASAGSSLSGSDEGLSRIDGSFRRFPLGVRKVGRIASTGTPLQIQNIAATNRDLKAEAEAGNLRLDLYYRLGVFPIELPPLRNRKVDIALLTEHLLQSLARRLGKRPPRLTQSMVAGLVRYDWPGNIRELQHVLERALITSPPGKLQFELTPTESTQTKVVADPVKRTDEILTVSQLRSLEANNIRRALEASGGKVYGHTEAAALLGMKPTTLSSRIRSLRVENSTRK